VSAARARTRLEASGADAVAPIQSGHRVYVHEAAMAPRSLVAALAERVRALTDVEIVHLHTNADAPYVAPDMEGHARHNALFVGANVREAVQAGRADFTPVFLSEVPSLFRDGTLPLDVALVQVSPPNEHGFCRLGTSVAAARAAVDHARLVIAEINPKVPRTAGNSALHIDDIDHAIEVDRELPEVSRPAPGPIERAIAEQVAAQIPDGSTLQVGIGAVPDAVLAALSSRSDLGIHTEMMSDGVIELLRSGAVTGARKSRFKGRVVTSFATGSRALYRACDDNPMIEFHPSDVVNDFREISAQYAMMAINSAVSIDLTGQVCADSIGPRILSGIGGQMDFVRGAVESPGGKAFIALPSTAKAGTVSRIVARLPSGSGVVTTRGHVQWVVTEHGAVDLRGRSLRQRAEMLISIAHPDFRGELRRAAREELLLAVR
jgi:4-hydroxybutyrate CoA-transferase